MIHIWVLYILINNMTLVPTTLKYTSYEECMHDGALFAMSVKVDAQLDSTLEPKCFKEKT